MRDIKALTEDQFKEMPPTYEVWGENDRGLRALAHTNLTREQAFSTTERMTAEGTGKVRYFVAEVKVLRTELVTERSPGRRANPLAQWEDED